MKRAGQVVLFPFPYADLRQGKLRPALLLGQLPGDYDDWLICMISSQTRHYIQGFDEIIRRSDEDFTQSGLKVESVIRVGRLAVVTGDVLVGAIGEISSSRLQRIKKNLASWLLGTSADPTATPTP